jgi:hypothetical protein
MKPLAKTVPTMEPVVAGSAVTRWKIAGALSLCTSIVWLFRRNELPDSHVRVRAVTKSRQSRKSLLTRDDFASSRCG